jgi:chaperonin GroEL (HSP60 family)
LFFQKSGVVSEFDRLRPKKQTKASPERARQEPVRQIVGNAGFEGAIVIEKIRGHENPNYGFNAANGQYEGLETAGAIDPAKVTRRCCRTLRRSRH